MIEEIERVAAQLRAELAGIAAEHGTAVVAIRPPEVRQRYGCNGVILCKALRASGFWREEGANIWRAIAGAPVIEIKGTTDDGATPAP